MKNLTELMKELTYKDHAIWNGIQITGVAYDSRKVELGNLFVAIKGFQSDGHQYIQQALDNGAIAVIVTEEEYCGFDFPWILVEDSRLALAEISSAYYGHPSEKLTVIGVTGTNGKTTTTNLIAHILESQGHTVGLIGTNHIRIGQEILPVSRTTPESSDLQALLAQMVEKGAEYAVMEVSSHALELARVACCEFDVVVFTNLTQDHLDYHETMENYCKAKTKLFTMLDRSKRKEGVDKTAVINIDDPWAAQFMVATAMPMVTYGIDKDASWKAEQVTIAADGASFTVDDMPVKLQLTGKFNIYNALAALSVGAALGIDEKAVIQALESAHGVAGRFQRVAGSGDYTVLVDYAHTPDGLKNVIETALEFAQGRVITVFGCGGDRDRTKRPKMGAIAAELSQYCVVTSDNPRTEEPKAIIADILPGVEAHMQPEQYLVEPDRHLAIQAAVRMARPGDVIILAGKGHEDYQEINGVKHHFDDYEEAAQAIAARTAGTLS